MYLVSIPVFKTYAISTVIEESVLEVEHNPVGRKQYGKQLARDKDKLKQYLPLEPCPASSQGVNQCARNEGINDTGTTQGQDAGPLDYQPVAELCWT